MNLMDSRSERRASLPRFSAAQAAKSVVQFAGKWCGRCPVVLSPTAPFVADDDAAAPPRPLLPARGGSLVRGREGPPRLRARLHRSPRRRDGGRARAHPRDPPEQPARAPQAGRALARDVQVAARGEAASRVVQRPRARPPALRALHRRVQGPRRRVWRPARPGVPQRRRDAVAQDHAVAPGRLARAASVPEARSHGRRERGPHVRPRRRLGLHPGHGRDALARPRAAHVAPALAAGGLELPGAHGARARGHARLRVRRAAEPVAPRRLPPLTLRPPLPHRPLALPTSASRPPTAGSSSLAAAGGAASSR